MYLLEDPPTTINGRRTAAKKLGKHICKEIQETLQYQLKDDLWTVLKGLSCVWKWPKEKRQTFWDVFNSTIEDLYHFWEVTGAPNVVSTDVRLPATWNPDTW